MAGILIRVAGPSLWAQVQSQGSDEGPEARSGFSEGDLGGLNSHLYG